jgi:hypothetical protein
MNPSLPFDGATPPVGAEGCALCWLKARIESGKGPLDIGLCYAVHLGTATLGGAEVPICTRHQEMIDVTAGHMMEAMGPAAARPPADDAWRRS